MLQNPDKVYFGKTVAEHEQALRPLIQRRQLGIAAQEPFTLKGEFSIWLYHFFEEQGTIPELVDYYSEIYNLR